jgi:hypothetical protein
VSFLRSLTPGHALRELLLRMAESARLSCQACVRRADRFLSRRLAEGSHPSTFLEPRERFAPQTTFDREHPPFTGVR